MRIPKFSRVQQGHECAARRHIRALLVILLPAATIPATSSAQSLIGLQTQTESIASDAGLQDSTFGTSDAEQSRALSSFSVTWGEPEDWNHGSASIDGHAIATRTRRSGDHELPAFAFATSVATVDNEGYRSAYAANPNPFNAAPNSLVGGSADASVNYSVTVTVSPGAPLDAYTTPVTLDVRMIWGASSTGAGQGGAQATLTGLDQYAGPVLLGVVHDASGLQFIHDGVSGAAADQFAISGGSFESPGWGRNLAQPFELLVYPETSFEIRLHASAGTGPNAYVGNNWTDAGFGSGFIDAVFAIGAGNPYSQYLALAYSDDLVIDVPGFDNPFAGTPLQQYGGSILPVPEPSGSLAMAAALGSLALLRRGRRNRAGAPVRQEPANSARRAGASLALAGAQAAFR